MRNALLLSFALLLAPATSGAQDWRSITQMRQAGSEELLRVQVHYGAGTLSLAPGSGALLYRATVRYDAEAFRPELAYIPGSLRVGLDDVRVRGRNVRSGELNLSLGRTVPVDLQLEFGAARADLDLSGIPVRRLRLATGASETNLRVAEPNPEVCQRIELSVGAAKLHAVGLGNLNARRLEFSGGVGEVTLDFTGRWQGDMAATVRMGLGSLTLRVPRGVGVQVRKGGLLVGFDSQDLVKRGDMFYSEDWQNAEHKLTVDIEAAFGSIRVAWVDAVRD